MLESVENGYLRISCEQIIEIVYGPPNSVGAQERIDAFRKKQIGQPVPARKPVLVDRNVYSVSLRGYEAVHEPCDFNGRIAFRAAKGKKEFIVNERGEKVGREYDVVGDPSDINGRLFFRAELGLKQFIVNEQGRIIGRKYDKVGVPKNVNGRVAFRAEENGKWFIVNEKGERIGGAYEEVGDPRDIGGRIVFRAKENGKWFIVNEKGERMSAKNTKKWATPGT